MALKKQHFIYIPGLGDFYDGGRRAFLAPWSWRRRVSVDLISMHWVEANESAHQKQQRIAQLIESVSQDIEVVLVGESAGGALAISMLGICPERIAKVVTLCGKNTNSRNISPHLLRKNPAFGDAVRYAEHTFVALNNEMKNKIHVIYSSLDHVVTPQNTLLPGVRSSVVKTPWHQFSIICIALFRFGLIRR
jgi:pimeloyl-ACP methyl ester carboxylesterase